jgi:ribosomal-protein-alanine N-acetyltransferase
VTRYLDWGLTASLEDATRFLDGVLHQYEQGTGLVLAIEERATGRVVGNVALMGLERARRAELGYVLARSCWGRGYTTEAAGLILHHAFTQMELEEVVAYVNPRNERSRRVLLRLGMKRDPGLHWYTIRGEPILHERYRARRSEFLRGDGPPG